MMQMQIIQASMAEAKAKKQFELDLKKQEIEDERRQQEIIDEIKANIAEELKKQYKQVVEGEIQILGDIRDWEIIEVERERQKIDREIEEGQKRKDLIEKEIGDNEKIDQVGQLKLKKEVSIVTNSEVSEPAADSLIKENDNTTIDIDQKADSAKQDQ